MSPSLVIKRGGFECLVSSPQVVRPLQFYTCASCSLFFFTSWRASSDFIKRY